MTLVYLPPVQFSPTLSCAHIKADRTAREQTRSSPRCTGSGRAMLHQTEGTSQPRTGLSSEGRLGFQSEVRFAHPAPIGAAGALEKAGIPPVPSSQIARLQIKVEKRSVLCSSALDHVFPKASHAVCQPIPLRMTAERQGQQHAEKPWAVPPMRRIGVEKRWKPGRISSPVGVGV